IQRSPVIQREPVMSDQNDSEFAAINQLLSSGALNPSLLNPSSRPHPLIRHTASLLRSRSRKDEHGILLPREQDGLNLKVSEGTLERALHVMSQVIAVLERQDHSVEVSGTHYCAHQRRAHLLRDGGASSKSRDAETESDQPDRSVGLR